MVTKQEAACSAVHKGFWGAKLWIGNRREQRKKTGCEGVPEWCSLGDTFPNGSSETTMAERHKSEEDGGLSDDGGERAVKCCVDVS